MSNRRKLKVAGAETAERCTSCGHRIGKNADALRVRTGQVICPRCRQSGGLSRLSCGHVALPGSFVVRNEGGEGESRCPQCAPDGAALAGNQRLGLRPLTDLPVLLRHASTDGVPDVGRIRPVHSG